MLGLKYNKGNKDELTIDVDFSSSSPSIIFLDAVKLIITRIIKTCIVFIMLGVRMRLVGFAKSGGSSNDLRVQ